MTVFIPGDKGETIPYSERGVHISLVSWNTSGNGDTGNVQQYQIITLLYCYMIGQNTGNIKYIKYSQTC